MLECGRAMSYPRREDGGRGTLVSVRTEQAGTWDNSRSPEGRNLGKQLPPIINTAVQRCRCNIHHSTGRRLWSSDPVRVEKL